VNTDNKLPPVEFQIRFGAKNIFIHDFYDLSRSQNREEIFDVFKKWSLPDISSVSQVKPDFEQIDESFFEGEPKENENIETDTDSEVRQKNKIENLLIGKNISAVLELRQNVRFKLTKMLLDSDPPVDKQAPITDKYINDIKFTKVAIIQFPENAILPDNSADKVLDEIIKFKATNKLRLVGHASKTGSKTTQGKRINMEISISRAQTIKNMLVNKGFDANNIEVLGKGDLEPLQEEVEEFGEAVNRRVEVFFISNYS
jgi:outer membrane protein OmpA-like peptidoglycan-associated protein